MRNAIARVAMVFVLLATSGCGIQVRPAFVVPASTQFNAQLFAPSTPVVLFPGQTVIVIVELVPINGFVLGNQIFFNAFTGANFGLVSFCPSILTIGAPAVGGIGFGGFPTIVFPLSPVGIGTCVLPINLGLSGVIQLDVQVAASGALGARTVTIRRHNLAPTK